MESMEPPYDLIKRGLQDGKVIPFLGAGASLGMRDPVNEPWCFGKTDGLPLGSELGSYLASLSGFENPPSDLATIAQYLEYQGGRAVLDSTLDDCLAKTSTIPQVHSYLSKLPGPLIIVTTNYDDLLERAFIKAGHEFDLIAYSNTIGTRESLLFWENGSQMKEIRTNELNPSFKRTVIYKFHGFRTPDPAAHESQYVITEDDYIEFLSRMVATKALPPSLVEHFKSHAFLFLGYSLADWNLRLLQNLVSRGRAKPTKSWAIQHKFHPFERPIWEQRHVNLYELSLPAFISKLERTK
jgi:hypothetical protein